MCSGCRRFSFLRGDCFQKLVEDGVEAVGGFEVGQVAYVGEDFEAGVGDGLLHLFCGVDVGVGVFGSDDDEGGDSDAG